MSLLMEALRKAEEAKRQMAAKKLEEIKQETPMSDAETSSVQELQALEEILEFDRDLEADFDAPTSPLRPAAFNLDIEDSFDFEVDEDFDLNNEASVADKPEVEELDFLQLDELSQFTSSRMQSNLKLDELESLEMKRAQENATDSPALASEDDSQNVPSSATFGLTLEDQTPNIERPSIIEVDQLTTIDETADLKSPPSPMAKDATVVEPIRATSNEASTSGSSEQSDLSAEDIESSGRASAKIAEESRKRESARAVFKAKQNGRDNTNRNRLIMVAVAIALFPLIGGGYLLLDAMGVFSTRSQFITPDNYSADERVFDSPLETAEATIVEEDVLTALSTEPLAAPSQEPEIAIVEPTIVAVETTPVPEQSAALVSEGPGSAVQSPIVLEAPVAEQQNIAPNGEVDTPAPTATADLPSAPETPVASETQSSAPINVVRTDNTEQVDPLLTQAYTSYRNNDFLGARARYQQVLREKPNNRDAMLGLAAVALRMDDFATARDGYIRLLELDPRDVHARAGLLETMPASDPVTLESELRGLFAAHPEVAQLAFALGNHFASQRRWSDAQQSYYDALLAAKASDNGPVSPDYAFNLAVSLERLNQLRPAYTFYQEALQQSELVAPSFDISVLRDRLDALQRALP